MVVVLSVHYQPSDTLDQASDRLGVCYVAPAPGRSRNNSAKRQPRRRAIYGRWV